MIKILLPPAQPGWARREGSGWWAWLLPFGFFSSSSAAPPTPGRTVSDSSDSSEELENPPDHWSSLLLSHLPWPSVFTGTGSMARPYLLPWLCTSLRLGLAATAKILNSGLHQREACFCLTEQEEGGGPFRAGGKVPQGTDSF